MNIASWTVTRFTSANLSNLTKFIRFSLVIPFSSPADNTTTAMIIMPSNLAVP